ncbi:hypothetical protein DNTS_017605 [Danionella cerebrum]|uniref:protein-tyrosine-phosphatase n=1 Tax=Danionella cerebrum TaxID=2873325 RepID=A0A553N3C7_9TELE|nr:hypothetical protein DNTS_017605 [Danionella translucida]
MVYYRDGVSERPPVSRILPHLYLGAETDVTQDALSDKGISYVLSVSRCCPQPSFLPQSQYLRIPIDDSLRDDLLPWIPQALHFIDGAMSAGGSVLVHCAAGISRSPALAVAYVMYNLKMDLDHAYRFVKERRPTISPNFNFLGQLQLFQGTLSLKDNNTHPQMPAENLDNCLQPSNENNKSSSKVAPLSNLNLQSNKDNICIINGRSADSTQNLYCENNNQLQDGLGFEVKKPGLTLSLSDKLGALTLCINPIEVQRTADITSRTQQAAPKSTAPTPTQLQIPSLAEKRKSLTLSLTPVSAVPQTQPNSSVSDHTGALEVPQETPANSENHRIISKGTSSRQRCSRSQRRKSKGNRSIGEPQTNVQTHSSHEQIQGRCGFPFLKEVAGGVEAVEGLDGDKSPMSPVGLTVNKILDWGERLLLGVLLGPRIKVGQAALPYRC